LAKASQRWPGVDEQKTGHFDFRKIYRKPLFFHFVSLRLCNFSVFLPLPLPLRLRLAWPSMSKRQLPPVASCLLPVACGLVHWQMATYFKSWLKYVQQASSFTIFFFVQIFFILFFEWFKRQPKFMEVKRMPYLAQRCKTNLKKFEVSRQTSLALCLMMTSNCSAMREK